MKKVLVIGLIGFALVGLSGCAQKAKVVIDHPVNSKCDMGKATSVVVKCS